jgi:uncharacterized membrane protein YphA (DoxX/SURF4 family)
MRILSYVREAPRYSLPILRYGLAFLFLWFGFSQFFDTGNWISWVPQWATAFSGLDAEDIVLANGALEVILGSFLAIGIWVRWSAFLLALHLLLIVFEIGLTPIGVRDLGLFFASVALAARGSDKWTLDAVVDGEWEE